MKKIFIASLIWIIVILVFCIMLIAKEKSNNDVEMENNYKKLLSPNFEERRNAVEYFYEFRKDKLDEKYMKALIDLFKREAEQSRKFVDFVSKGGTADKLPKDIAYINTRSYGTYPLYLSRIVSKSKDKDVLSILLKTWLDPESIVSFGDDAVEAVMDTLKKQTNPDGKMTVIRILEEMLKPKETGYVASGDTRNRIKEVLIQATKDSDRYVRSVSLEALGESQDKDVIPILENIAKNDPYSVVVKDPSGKEVKRYPVREDAEEALQKLKAKESEKK